MVAYRYNSDSDKLIRIDVKFALTIALFYHLDIKNKEFDIGALIKAIHLLPELDTLKIHSLSLNQTNVLNFEEFNILYSTNDTCKITKVYFEKMNDIEEFYILLTVCPYMKYFKVDNINHMDIESVLRFIIQKINYDCNNYIQLLCFRIVTPDNEIIEKLNRMIHIEKLLLTYKIKHLAENIYLE
ncbi:unnamed protein product [Rotaria sp. Silwood1]|nr:unnamed protein product [Rotaria sp. Silwood1]CAF1556781.1 unnamed protein product [Rotaria sp. Silwood1]